MAASEARREELGFGARVGGLGTSALIWSKLLSDLLASGMKPAGLRGTNLATCRLIS